MIAIYKPRRKPGAGWHEYPFDAVNILVMVVHLLEHIQENLPHFRMKEIYAGSIIPGNLIAVTVHEKQRFIFAFSHFPVAQSIIKSACPDPWGPHIFHAQQAFDMIFTIHLQRQPEQIAGVVFPPERRMFPGRKFSRCIHIRAFGRHVPALKTKPFDFPLGHFIPVPPLVQVWLVPYLAPSLHHVLGCHGFRRQRPFFMGAEQTGGFRYFQRRQTVPYPVNIYFDSGGLVSAAAVDHCDCGS